MGLFREHEMAPEKRETSEKLKKILKIDGTN